jgi:hypothetical protein
MNVAAAIGFTDSILAINVKREQARGDCGGRLPIRPVATRKVRLVAAARAYMPRHHQPPLS